MLTAIMCPPGTEYSPCGPACHQSCQNIGDEPEAYCTTNGCVEGCFCPNGTYLHGTACSLRLSIGRLSSALMSCDISTKSVYSAHIFFQTPLLMRLQTANVCRPRTARAPWTASSTHRGLSCTRTARNGRPSIMRSNFSSKSSEVDF